MLQADVRHRGSVRPTAIAMVTDPLKNVPVSPSCDCVLLLALVIKVNYKHPTTLFHIHSPPPVFTVGLIGTMIVAYKRQTTDAKCKTVESHSRDPTNMRLNKSTILHCTLNAQA